VNNLYWIYIDYLIRMSTNKEQRFNENPSTTVTTNVNVPIGNERDSSQDDDSSDDELPAFAGGPTKNTPVIKVDLSEQEQEQEELEVDEEASLSSGKTNETASGDSFIGINVSESNKSISSEIDDSQQSAIVNQGPSFGRNSSSSDDSSSDIDLAGSDKTEEEQNVAPGEQNVIIAEREVAAAMRELDDFKRSIEENTYIRTHINGVLDGDDDVLFIKLNSPDNATTFYEERYDTNNNDQKELIPFIFLFAKTYRKIKDSFDKINLLLEEDNKISEINTELTTLQGQLEMFYELPLQHKNGEQLISNPDYYFGENQTSVIIIEGKTEIFFGTPDGQKNWNDFTEDYINNEVSSAYNEGKVKFAPDAQKRLKQFKEKFLTKKSSSIMSRMGSMFGSRKGGNKKQTRRPLIHKKRQTRRK
jgi:hypothetical protein